MAPEVPRVGDYVPPSRPHSVYEVTCDSCRRTSETRSTILRCPHCGVILELHWGGK